MLHATNTRKEIDKRIKESFDALQAFMEANMHIENMPSAELLYSKCAALYNFLDDEHIDYLQGVRHALDEGLEWNV
jgi:hypothetical protein